MPLNIRDYGGTCRVDFCPATEEGNEAGSINPQCVARDCGEDTTPNCRSDDNFFFTDTADYGVLS